MFKKLFAKVKFSFEHLTGKRPSFLSSGFMAEITMSRIGNKAHKELVRIHMRHCSLNIAFSADP
jgi:hypothetical protein